MDEGKLQEMVEGTRAARAVLDRTVEFYQGQIAAAARFAQTLLLESDPNRIVSNVTLAAGVLETAKEQAKQTTNLRILSAQLEDSLERMGASEGVKPFLLDFPTGHGEA